MGGMRTRPPSTVIHPGQIGPTQSNRQQAGEIEKTHATEVNQPGG